MKTPDILAALIPLVDAFRRLGIPYHIGGSIASSAYGIARSTQLEKTFTDAGITAGTNTQRSI